MRNCLFSKPYDFVPKTIGEHILKRRLERGLYQKDVAKVLGVNPWTVLNWEKGRTEPTVSNIPALIQFLGYDPAPPETDTSIADRLKAKRRVLGIEHREAARIMGVDPCTWLAWENGGRILMEEHRRMVARFLDSPELISPVI